MTHVRRVDDAQYLTRRLAEVVGIPWIVAALFYATVEPIATSGLPGYSYADN